MDRWVVNGGGHGHPCIARVGAVNGMNHRSCYSIAAVTLASISNPDMYYADFSSFALSPPSSPPLPLSPVFSPPSSLRRRLPLPLPRHHLPRPLLWGGKVIADSADMRSDLLTNGFTDIELGPVITVQVSESGGERQGGRERERARREGR